MNLSAQPGQVYLAGAGPGDASLLTLRALRLLETADVILPDDLVSNEILNLAHAGRRDHSRRQALRPASHHSSRNPRPHARSRARRQVRSAPEVRRPTHLRPRR